MVRDMPCAQENIDFQSTILSRFDLIFIIRDVRNEERDQQIARHVMALHRCIACCDLMHDLMQRISYRIL